MSKEKSKTIDTEVQSKYFTVVKEIPEKKGAGGRRVTRYSEMYKALASLPVGTKGKVNLEKTDNVTNVQLALVSRDSDKILKLYIRNPVYKTKVSKSNKKYKHLVSGDLFFEIAEKGKAGSKE